MTSFRFCFFVFHSSSLLRPLRKDSEMATKICFSKNLDDSEIINVQISATRSSALDLLALGTRTVLETLNISLYEYLEALMEAKENPLSQRVIIDESYMNRQESHEDVKSD